MFHHLKSYLRRFLLFFVLSATPICAEQEIKVLVLVIASDKMPLYIAMQEIWRSYMHLDAEHVEAYFIKGDEHLGCLYKLQDDVLWSNTKECISPGILHKTVLSMEYFASRLDEFDYVLRPNLSSFYVFPQLLKFLKTLPREKCYCAFLGEYEGIPYGSGCGFILSVDLVKLLIEKKSELFQVPTYYDDVAIGKFLYRQGIHVIPAPRTDFYPIRRKTRPFRAVMKGVLLIR